MIYHHNDLVTIGCDFLLVLLRAIRVPRCECDEYHSVIGSDLLPDYPCDLHHRCMLTIVVGREL
jgi:hypothetical protein